MPVLQALTERDVDAVVAVQREGAVVGLGHIFPQDEHPFPAQSVRERWVREIHASDVDCFAIVRGGQVAGFAATRADELLHFGTALATWGSGLAGAAHDEILEHFRRRGFTAVWLRVFEENERAIRFYVRRGWMPTDQTSRTSFAPHPVLRRYDRVLD